MDLITIFWCNFKLYSNYLGNSKNTKALLLVHLAIKESTFISIRQSTIWHHVCYIVIKIMIRFSKNNKMFQLILREYKNCDKIIMIAIRYKIKCLLYSAHRRNRYGSCIQTTIDHLHWWQRKVSTPKRNLEALGDGVLQTHWCWIHVHQQFGAM